MKAKRWVVLLSAVVVVGAICSGRAASAQEPPAAAKTVREQMAIDVKDHGAKGDGETDDRAAIQAAINAARPGSTIFFPAGTYYFAEGVRLEKRNQLMFTGDPGATLKAAGGRSKFIFAFKECADITISGLCFDMNGTTHFGPGMSFHACKRVRIHQNHFFDSNFQKKMTADRYAICFALGSEMSEDIWISENLIEHLQVEVDKARRVHVINNRSIAPELATGFGSFTLQKNVALEDIEFVGNYVEDPQAYGINVAADGEREGAMLRRVLIANNIVMCKTRAPMLAGIMVGSRDGKAVKGAQWENITVANNLVCYAPGVRKRHEETGIRVQVINDGEGINRVMITGNTVVDEAGIANWGIETRGLKDAVISNNAVFGSQGGILCEGSVRSLAQGNRVSDVSAEGFRFERSKGENLFFNNFVMGKSGKPFVVSGLKPSDRVDQSQAPASVSAGTGAASPSVAPTVEAEKPMVAPQAAGEKSDVTGEMIRIANQSPDKPAPAQPVSAPSASPAAGAAPAAAAPSAALSEAFDSLGGIRTFGSTGVTGVKGEINTETKREGTGAIKVSWTSGSSAYNMAAVSINRPAVDISGRSFEVSLMPLDANSGSYRVIFYDRSDKQVETHQLHVAKPNQWTTLKLTQGRQSTGGWYYRKGPGDPGQVSKIQFQAVTKEKLPAGTVASVLWDGFRVTD